MKANNKQRKKNMNLDNLTFKDIRDLQNLLNSEPDSHFFQVGKNYFIRTVTHHLTGKLVKVGPKELVLVDAAWIADDGRFMNAIRDGKLNEVEPFPDGDEVIVGRGSIIDCVEWKHELPREQK
jgi:hypothetical protein